MKLNNRMKPLVIAPVAIGFILIVIGIVSQNEGVVKAGIIVLFGGSGIAALITVTVTITSIIHGRPENTDAPAAQADHDGETNDAQYIKSGKQTAGRAARKILTDRDKEYRKKIEDELTHECELLLEMDNVTDADIDELVDRETEIETEFIKSDETDADFDSYAVKLRLLYDEMRRKIMNDPPLYDEAYEQSEAVTPPIEPTEDKETETATPPCAANAAEAAEAPTEFKTPPAVPNADDGSIEPETPSLVSTKPVRPTRTKRATVDYKGIKKK